MKYRPTIRDVYGMCWLLDYHECQDAIELTNLLSEISLRRFQVEQVIPKIDGSFVVLFRRNDIG